MECSPVTRSVLVEYDPKHIAREELLLRISLVFSSENKLMPVGIMLRPREIKLNDLALISLSLIILSGLARLGPVKAGMLRGMELAAAGATLAAVGSHAADEMRQGGKFHPEVLSGIYLTASFLKGGGNASAFITWIAAFGRHLAEPGDTGVKVEVTAHDDEPDIRYEAFVSELPLEGDSVSLIRMIVKFLIELLPVGAGRENLMNQIREVSRDHDTILEGIGDISQRVSLRMSKHNTDDSDTMNT